jgi:hypothetical protein
MTGVGVDPWRHIRGQARLEDHVHVRREALVGVGRGDRVGLEPRHAELRGVLVGLIGPSLRELVLIAGAPHKLRFVLVPARPSKKRREDEA